MSAFAAAIAPGAEARRSARYRLTTSSSSAGGGDRVHEPDRLRVRRVEPTPRQEQLPRGRPADPRQDERRDHGRDDPEPHLREAEHRVGGRHDDVRHGAETGAAAERGPVHARHDRHGQAIDREEHARGFRGILRVLLAREVGHPRHPAHVRARAERRSGPGDHDRAHLPVGADRIGPPRHLADHLVVERVAHVGPVEHEVLHRTVVPHVDALEPHERIPRCCALASGLEPLASGPVYILNTPNPAGASGAFAAADSPSASACRVSSGSRIPSSQRRAVE